MKMIIARLVYRNALYIRACILTGADCNIKEWRIKYYLT
jgi:hypothetical protein